MGRYYFYTDPSKLVSQSATNAFGPQMASSSLDKYRFTQTHNSQGKTPVIAVCGGTICFQSSGGSVGTIILRPDYQPAFDFPYIQYFVYKNIDLTDFIHPTNGLIGENDFDFIADIRTKWASGTDAEGTDKVKAAHEVLGMSYNINFPETGIFENDKAVDNLFHHLSAERQLPRVSAGDHIGNFLSGSGGFEILLERLGHIPKLGDVRNIEHILQVASLAAGANEAQTFEHWHLKDACLNYVDPCAFFGSFAESHLLYKKANNQGELQKERANHRDEIISDVLTTFGNKDKVYLDVRNDYGFALNYFRDRGHSLWLQDRSATDYHELDQMASGWPIASFTLGDLNSTGVPPGEIKRGFFRTALQIPQGNSAVPLVYLSKAYVRRFRKLKRKDRIQFPGDLGEVNTKGIHIGFPIAEEGGVEKLCAGYFKINFYDMDRDQTAASQAATLAPSKEHYLNGLFRPLDMEQTIARREGSLYYTTWHEEVLVNLTDVGGPCYVANLGLAVDEEHTTLFAYPEYFVHGTYSGEIPKAFTTWATSSRTSEKMFIQQIFGTFKHKQLAKHELDIQNMTDDLDVVVVENAPFNLASAAFRQTENPEDYIFIMFDHAEVAAQKTAMENHIPDILGHPIFITRTSEENGLGLNNIYFASLMLDLTGYIFIGITPQKEPVIINKKVFVYKSEVEAA